MKLILCLNRDIHAALALNLLFFKLKSHQVKIIISNEVGKPSNSASQIADLKKYEQSKMDELFAKIDQANSSKNKFLTFDQIASFFHHKITSYQDINSAEAIADIKNFAPDLIISIRFGQIFKDPIINIPSHGIINLHSGLMPKYRGIMSSFWAILNGEDEIGCTLHYIENAKIDDGKIINFSRKKTLWNRSFIYNVSSLYNDGCNMIIDFITKIEQQKSIEIKSLEQAGKKNYFSTPKQNEVEKFSKIMPLTLQQDVAEIYNNWIKI